MALNSGELARRDGNRIDYSDQPMRLLWMVDQAFSRDNHLFIITFSASLHAINKPADRELLREVLLGENEAITTKIAIAHFAAVIETAVMDCAKNLDAGELLSDAGRSQLLAAIRTVADARAFACGCELLAPFQVDLRSPSLQSQKMEQLIRSQATDRLSGQVAHLERATDLLKRFEELRASMPNQSAARILQHLSMADQAPAFQSLLLATSQGAAPALWAVSGSTLFKADLSKPEAAFEQFPLTDELGPLRSIRRDVLDGNNVLLIGARSGVLIVPESDARATPRKYIEPATRESPMGFNSACLWNGHLCATHAAAGVIAWSLLRADPAHRVHAEGARHLCVLSPRTLLWSCNTSVRTLDVDFTSRSVFFGDDTVISVLPRANDAVILRDDGTGATLNLDAVPSPTPINVGGTVTCAALLPWLGEYRVLASLDNGPILCRGTDDPLIVQYSSPSRGFRKIAASSHHVAALTEDRRHLVIWNSWEGNKPVREISLAGITKHRMADVAF